jgi:hypothetical protein
MLEMYQPNAAGQLLGNLSHQGVEGLVALLYAACFSWGLVLGVYDALMIPVSWGKQAVESVTMSWFGKGPAVSALVWCALSRAAQH